jgi:outer membrane protein assembly factor BamE (lipoprotein component of BamABCDE complex)
MYKKMKKLLLLFIFVVAGCSTDSNECICGKAKYAIIEQQGYFYVNNMPIDCKTGKPTKQIPNKNAFFVDCVN